MLPADPHSDPPSVPTAIPLGSMWADPHCGEKRAGGEQEGGGRGAGAPAAGLASGELQVPPSW